jgi:hypothetical protein
VARYLRSGRLPRVLPDFQTPPADIYAVYLQRHHTSARVREFCRLPCQGIPRVESSNAATCISHHLTEAFDPAVVRRTDAKKNSRRNISCSKHCKHPRDQSRKSVTY